MANPDPRQNHLIAELPPGLLQRWLPDLEWVSLPESFLLAASSLANAKFTLASLVVHEQRMI